MFFQVCLPLIGGSQHNYDVSRLHARPFCRCQRGGRKIVSMQYVFFDRCAQVFKLFAEEATRWLISE
jgi:hypothetical protein